ncbi:hypothetical protein ACSBR2_022727 [Camellia fascicularis]
MQIIACNSSNPLLQPPHQRTQVPPKTTHSCGRRELCFDGISSVCSSSEPRHPDSPDDNFDLSPHSASTPRIAYDHSKELIEVIKKNFLFTTRRTFFSSLFMYLCYHPSRYLPAHALGDPSVTVEEVTPSVYSSGALFPSEERTVQLFEKNTYSVVNIFDVTLRPQLNVTGVVEVPEGNGSGVVWDGQGHIVTNYHVIGNSLSRNPSSGQVVARVNILASEGVQKNFEGKLIGADRAKDLAVLKVEATEELLRPVKVGQSSSLRVGQQCLAIGNPFGFDHTLTVGVISGLNRDIFSQTGVTIGGGIQTDAAINPGNRYYLGPFFLCRNHNEQVLLPLLTSKLSDSNFFPCSYIGTFHLIRTNGYDVTCALPTVFFSCSHGSGGPLLDSKGNLIGINTAIFTQTGNVFSIFIALYAF